MNFRIVSPVLAVLAVLSLLPAYAATTVTLRPDGTTSADGDAFVTTGPSGTLAANNYGAAGAVAVSAALTKGSFDSLLRFDISTAKASFDATYGAGNWAVSSVTLELTTTSPNNGIFTNPSVAGMFGVKWIPTDSWVEGSGDPTTPSGTGVNWNDIVGLSAGAESEGIFTLASVANGVTAQYTLTPSSSLLAELLAGTPVSFLLGSADGTMSAVFNSRSFGTANRRPALAITAVPEPGRVSLISAGMGLLLRRRRQLLPL